MSEDQNVPRLQKLGLNLYESRAYLALLSRRQLSATLLSHAALIPQSRTYDTLDSLRAKGFAIATPTTPKLYTAVPPESVLPKYYAKMKEETRAPVLKLEQEAESKLNGLTEAYNTLLKELPNISTGDPMMPQPIWVVEGRDSIESAVISMVQNSKSELIRITRPPNPDEKAFFDPFYIVGMENLKFVDEALKRSVGMRWLSLTREIPTFLGLRIGETPERRYFEKEEDIAEKFFVADRKTILLNLRDPNSKSFGLNALLMESRAASSVFCDHFESMWDRAKPLTNVLSRAASTLETVCSKLAQAGLTRPEVAVYNTLASIGANSESVLAEDLKEQKAHVREIPKVLDRLRTLGLVHRNNSLQLWMVTHPTNVLESIKAGALSQL